MKTLFSGLVITALLICNNITECNAQKKFEEENQRDLATISKVYAKYAMDEAPGITADTNLIGIWKMKEDEDSHNYFVFERNSPNSYALTYMNHEGANRTWENFTAFFSRIGKTEFINIPFYNWEGNIHGYFFLKVIEKDKRGFELTAAMVADPTLKKLPDGAAVRARIKKNMDNPDYFKKPVHFRKVLPLLYCK